MPEGRSLKFYSCTIVLSNKVHIMEKSLQLCEKFSHNKLISGREKNAINKIGSTTYITNQGNLIIFFYKKHGSIFKSEAQKNNNTNHYK